MAESKKLVSIRVSENDWTDFMAWADNNGSNASAEINRYIKSVLGRIDNDIQAVNTVNNVNTDNLVTVEKLQATIEPFNEMASAIAKLQEEINQLKKPDLSVA